MSYVTLQGLIERYGEAELIQLTDRLGDGVVDSATVERAIADVDAEIDAYLCRVTTLPLAAEAPARRVLSRFAGAMVRYYLYREGVPELVWQQYTAAVQFLSRVASGQVSLGPDDAGVAAPDSAAPSYLAPSRVFDELGLAGF